MEPWSAVDARSGDVEGLNGTIKPWTLAVEAWMVKMDPHQREEKDPDPNQGMRIRNTS
jgi:hypothetical protein